MYRSYKKLLLILTIIAVMLLSACVVMNTQYTKSIQSDYVFNPYSKNWQIDQLSINDARYIGSKDEFYKYFEESLEKRYFTIFLRVSLEEDLADVEELGTYSLKGIKRTLLSGSNGNLYALYEMNYYAGDNVYYAYRTKDSSLLNYKERELYNIAKSFIETNVKEGMSDFEKELIIHDYIIDRLEYSNEALGQDDEDNITGAYSLITGLANCQGYTDAFYMLSNMVGLKSFKVNGEVDGEAHTWNIVEIDGKWTFVDATFNDTAFDEDYNFYGYFNVPLDYLRKSHVFYDHYDFYDSKGYDSFYYEITGQAVLDEIDFYDKIFYPLTEDADQLLVFIVDMPIQPLIDRLKTLNKTMHFSYFFINDSTLLDIKVGQ